MSGQAMQLQELMAFFKVDANALPAAGPSTPAATKAAPRKPAAVHPALAAASKAPASEAHFVKF